MVTHDGKYFRLALLLLFAGVMGMVSACKDEPVVGSRLAPEDPVLSADSIAIPGLSVVSNPSFSGRLTYFTAGKVNDPVFGEIEAMAIIRPSVLRNVATDSIAESAEASLVFRAQHLFGEESTPGHFKVVELERSWRSSSWRYDSIPALGNNVVGEFTVEREDSVTVPLSNEWLQRYRDIFLIESAAERDSVYMAEMPGLAIVAANGGGKLFSAEGLETGLLILQNDEEVTDFEQTITAWAVSLISGIPDDVDAGDSLPVINTLGSLIEMEIAFTEEFLGSKSFARMELVLHEDVEALEEVPFVRPRPQTMLIYILNEGEIDYALNVDPTFAANKDETDHSFRLNLTSYADEMLHGGRVSNKFYIAIGSNDGRILPTLINGPSHSDLQPQLLITSILGQ